MAKKTMIIAAITAVAVIAGIAVAYAMSSTSDSAPATTTSKPSTNKSAEQIISILKSLRLRLSNLAITSARGA